jgi:hypothetical protein
MQVVVLPIQRVRAQVAAAAVVHVPSVCREVELPVVTAVPGALATSQVLRSTTAAVEVAVVRHLDLANMVAETEHLRTLETMALTTLVAVLARQPREAMCPKVETV